VILSRLFDLLHETPGLMMVDRREGISTDVEKILRDTFEKEVFKTVVRVNTKLKACPQKRKSIFDTEGSKGKGYMDYLSVTQEFLKRVEKTYAN
jgi:cellulose biosynthesis protein BcsQ